MRRNAPETIPVSVIGRLAGSRDYAGRGLGADILSDALRRIAVASQSIGIGAVIVTPRMTGRSASTWPVRSLSNILRTAALSSCRSKRLSPHLAKATLINIRFTFRDPHEERAGVARLCVREDALSAPCKSVRCEAGGHRRDAKFTASRSVLHFGAGFLPRSLTMCVHTGLHSGARMLSPIQIDAP